MTLLIALDAVVDTHMDEDGAREWVDFNVAGTPHVRVVSE